MSALKLINFDPGSGIRDQCKSNIYGFMKQGKNHQNYFSTFKLQRYLRHLYKKFEDRHI